MLSFGSNDIFNTFFHYNNYVWPMPMIGYVLGLIVLISLCYENSLSDRMICLVLAFFWMWVGIVQQITFFSKIDNFADIFGILFIIQSVLFLWFGVVKNRLIFRIPFSGYNLIGIIYIIYSIIAYPIIGFFTGHSYPSSAVFGIAASPTAIFTFGVFLFAVEEFPIYMIFIPLIWSLLGFGSAMIMGIHEDFVLFVAGVSCFVLTIIRNRTERNKDPLLYMKPRE
jgi:hypothetical protein